MGIFFACTAAVMAAAYYGDRQEFQGSIQYNPLPASEAAKLMLPVDDVRSLGAMLKAPEVLTKAIADLNLPMTPTALARQIETKTPFGSQTIAVTLKWQDGSQDGNTVLDTIMKSFVAYSNQMRENKINSRLQGLQNALEQCEGDIEKARERCMAVLFESGVTDLAQDLRLANARLDAASAALSQIPKKQAIGQDQVARMEAAIARLIREEQQANELDSAKPSSNSKSKLPPERLQVLIHEERQKHLLQTQIHNKNIELERARSLARVGAASPAEIDRIKGELAVLEVQTTDNSTVLQYREALADSLPSVKLPLLQVVQSKKLELELELHANEKNLEFQTQEKNAALAEVTRLNELQRQVTPLIQQSQSREPERQRIQSHLEQLRLLKDMAVGEMTVVQSPYQASAGTSRRWLIAFATLLTGLLAWFGLTQLVQSHCVGRSCDHVLRGMGLSVLGRLPEVRTSSALQAATRRLSLMLRQRLPAQGTSIMFVPVAEQTIDELLAELGACYARRDEKVLIMDCVLPVSSKDAGSVPGLADFLAYKMENIGGLVKPTSIEGVDLLAAGNAIVPPDVLATQRMHDVMAQLRSIYSLILVKGHAVTSTTEVEILAGYHHAVVLTLHEDHRLQQEESEAIRNYMSVGMPVLGCVTLKKADSVQKITTENVRRS